MRRRKSVLREVERHMVAIGKHRDALRRILADLTVIADALEDGYADLEIAVQTFSLIQWDDHTLLTKDLRSVQSRKVLPPLTDLLAHAIGDRNGPGS